jgi:hypothetical protein
VNPSGKKVFASFSKKKRFLAFMQLINKQAVLFCKKEPKNFHQQSTLTARTPAP